MTKSSGRILGRSTSKLCPMLPPSQLRRPAAAIISASIVAVVDLPTVPVMPTTTAGQVALKNGPKGYHCVATKDTSGHASVGACYKGTLAFPKSGFLWNGS